MSDGPLARVGISISVTIAVGRDAGELVRALERRSHRAARASTATPYGLGREDASTCGVKTPLRSSRHAERGAVRRTSTGAVVGSESWLRACDRGARQRERGERPVRRDAGNARAAESVNHAAAVARHGDSHPAPRRAVPWEAWRSSRSRRRHGVGGLDGEQTSCRARRRSRWECRSRSAVGYSAKPVRRHGPIAPPRRGAPPRRSSREPIASHHARRRLARAA